METSAIIFWSPPVNPNGNIDTMQVSIWKASEEREKSLDGVFPLESMINRTFKLPSNKKSQQRKCEIARLLSYTEYKGIAREKTSVDWGSHSDIFYFQTLEGG